MSELRAALLALFESDAAEGIDVYGTGQPGRLVDAVLATVEDHGIAVPR